MRARRPADKSSRHLVAFSAIVKLRPISATLPPAFAGRTDGVPFFGSSHLDKEQILALSSRARS